MNKTYEICGIVQSTKKREYKNKVLPSDGKVRNFLHQIHDYVQSYSAVSPLVDNAEHSQASYTFSNVPITWRGFIEIYLN